MRAIKERKFTVPSEPADVLKENGLTVLVELPCKVGDTVYGLFCNEVYEKKINRIIINRFTTPQIWVETRFAFASESTERWDLAIGKTIFLTREDAEKALEAQRRNESESD